ncbi:tetratricopeptide repeat protein [Oscillatoria sp. FACHB-1407]|uniref:tetratricopeptide repeat protein n=1 Tax=Oscillatoria sp. FACHB-1407 TaxID=2692847 RepID=UPI0016873665|nr:tetratricopeptide repeat protein [Oscillatoria sp. FACHB-1407]MBD2460102.1 tetratricopeptide repeat protein [Oscillatoria sp. FACHB-1407]
MSNPLADLDLSSVADASDSVAWYNQGEALANLGRYPDALYCFERVIKIRPDYAAAWVFRGVILIHLERYEEALDSCEQALSLQPEDSEAWTFRGVALHRLGDYRSAYASYDRALGVKRQSMWQTLLQRLRKVWKSLKNSQAHWLS